MQRHLHGRQVEVEHGSQHLAEGLGAIQSQRDSKDQCQETIRDHHDEIHPQDLLTSAADGFHDRDLAFLLRQQCRHSIDDQKNTQEQGQYAE